jgi:V8-like Glu-specific endopeptidase
LPQCSANILQQLVQPHSVLRYNVASGAVYNVKATSAQLDLSQLPGGVSYAAVQPPKQQQDPVASPAPIDAGGDDATGEDNNDEEEPPYILEPEIVVDLPTKRNSSSPSPSPALPEDNSNTRNSASPSPAVLPEAESNSSNNSSSGSGSPVPAVDGSEAQASPSPAAALSAAVSADVNPSPSPAVSSASAAAAAATTTATAVDASDSNSSVGRKLRFVRKGNDERTDVSSRPAFPLSAVGQLLSHGQEWHCSASLIAERTIITAAHCVYDPVTGSWAKSLSFAPSKFRDAAGSVTAPAGTAAVAEVFIVGGFAVGEPQFLWEKDMAVVKLAVGTKLARKVGHLGVFIPAAIAHQQHAARMDASDRADVPASSGSTTGSGRKLKLQHQAAPATAGVSSSSSSSSSSSKARSIWSGMLSTAGYPSDRQQGTLVTTKCLSQILPGTTPRAATLKLQRCSTALGQSGGPLIDAAGNVGGVVAYEVLGPQGYNGGCAMTPWLWLNLVSPNLV